MFNDSVRSDASQGIQKAAKKGWRPIEWSLDRMRA